MSGVAAHRMEKRLEALVCLLGLLCLPPVTGASVAASCGPLLAERTPFFATTLDFRDRVPATRDVAVPARSRVLAIAAETGIDVTMQALDGGRVIQQAATPVYRTGVERLTLTTEHATTLRLSVTPKTNAQARGRGQGRVVIRVFVTNDTTAEDSCTQAQELLAAADAHYAAAQAAATDNGSDKHPIDVPHEYQAAANQYLAAARAPGSAAPLAAYAQQSSAAVLYDWVQDWTGARSAAQAATKAYQQLGDTYGAARSRALDAAALMEIALTYRSPAQGAEGVRRTASALRQAREELATVAAFHKKRHEPFDEALALNNIGVAFYYAGLNDNAIPTYGRALTLFVRLGEERWKSIARQNIALAEYELGRVNEAISQYDRLLQETNPDTDPNLFAALLNNSSLANWLGGNMDVALRQYAHALELLRKLQRPREEARSLFGIGSVYETLGDSDRALDFYRQTLRLRSAELDARGRAASLRSTANVLRAQGHAQEALTMHDEALSLASTGAQRAPIQIQRARDLEALGQYNTALQQLDSVLKEADAGRQVVIGQALLERARIRISTRARPLAEADLHAALAIFIHEESPVDEFSSWVTLAQAQRQRGASQEALESLTQALRLAEEVRLQSSSPELRASLMQPLRPAFDLKIAVLSERYFASLNVSNPALLSNPAPPNNTGRERRDALEALATAEQARARAFTDFERLDIEVSLATAKLLERRRDIYRELAARHFQLESRRDRAADDDERVRSIRSDITTLRVQLDDTEARLNAAAAGKHTEWASDSGVINQHRIPPDTAIVEYWLGSENAVAWVVTHDRLDMIDLGPSETVTTAARQFYTALSAFGSAPAALRLHDSERLYALVIQPLEHYIEPYHTLIFAPDGALHYVPFAALRAVDGAQSGYLVEHHDVAIAPSARMLLNPSAADVTDTAGATPTVDVTHVAIATPTADVTHAVRATHTVIGTHTATGTLTARSDRILLVADPVYSADDVRLQRTFASLASHQAGIPSEVLRGFGTPPDADPLPDSQDARSPGDPGQAESSGAVVNPGNPSHPVGPDQPKSSSTPVDSNKPSDTGHSNDASNTSDTPNPEALDAPTAPDSPIGTSEPADSNHPRGATDNSLPRLQGTAREAAAIATLFPPGQIDRLEGFAATKERFLAAPLERYRWIHVATHATADAQIPGLSALALSAFDSNGQRIDNLLLAADLMTVRLNADLVVLSACETALGKNVSGEGLIGLRYIALARGARTVVASLWEVPDQPTSELMTAFYHSFLGGRVSAAAALSEAMRARLKRSNSDPGEWGSFIATTRTLQPPAIKAVSSTDR